MIADNVLNAELPASVNNKWCSIEDCPVHTMGQKMVISVGRNRYIPFYCLLCSNFEKKEMNIELIVDQTISVLEGK